MSASATCGRSSVGLVTSEAMRDTLGAFATDVVVVTAQGPDRPIGFTCQSFSSLSLDPPLVCSAPARSSSSWPRIRDVGTFCVNVLAAGQKAPQRWLRPFRCG
jgi:3-hydroxy-9,10-secoandrosta-1,3,5(10)-triene-9,17-dione monooxygenase reductase component